MTSPRLARLLVSGLALLVASVALAGCSIDRSASGAAASGGTSASLAAPTPSDSAGPRGVIDDERRAKLQRDRWTGTVAQHVACVDGAYTVDRNADALVVEVTGDCREVTVLASAATVLLPAVDTLTVEGDGNIVIAASVQTLALPAGADANLVGWESGTPVVDDAGTLNGTTPIS